MGCYEGRVDKDLTITPLILEPANEECLESKDCIDYDNSSNTLEGIFEGVKCYSIDFSNEKTKDALEWDICAHEVKIIHLTAKQIHQYVIFSFKKANLEVPERIYLSIDGSFAKIFIKLQSDDTLKAIANNNNYRHLLANFFNSTHCSESFLFRIKLHQLEKTFTHTKTDLDRLIDNINESALKNESALESLLVQNSNSVQSYNLTEIQISEIAAMFTLKIIPKESQHLLGFYYKDFDYNIDPYFVSFFLLPVNESLTDLKLISHMNDMHGLKIREVIRNPFESSAIVRIILHKTNKSNNMDNDNENILKNLTGVNVIDGKKYLLLRIQQNKQIHPEDLLKPYQVSIRIDRIPQAYEQLIAKIENNVADVLECCFLSGQFGVITFYDKVNAQKFISMGGCDVVFDGWECRIQFERYHAYLPITGKKVNIDRLVGVNLSLSLPKRQPYLWINNYIPSIEHLLNTKSMWHLYTIENDSFFAMTVENFVESYFNQKKIESKLCKWDDDHREGSQIFVKEKEDERKLAEQMNNLNKSEKKKVIYYEELESLLPKETVSNYIDEIDKLFTNIRKRALLKKTKPIEEKKKQKFLIIKKRKIREPKKKPEIRGAVILLEKE